MTTALTSNDFWSFAAERPDAVAIVDVDAAEGPRTISYGELLARTNALAHGLRAQGLQPGDALAAVLQNEPAFLELMLACQQIGLVFVPMNFAYTAQEMEAIFNDCRPQLIVASDWTLAAAVAAAEAVGLSAETVYLVAGLIVGRNATTRRYAELFEGQPVTLPAERVAGSVMRYTSGTTGRPKGVYRQPKGGDPAVVVPRRFQERNKKFRLERGNGAHYVAGPLFFTGPGAFAEQALHIGHAVILHRRWKTELALELMQRYRVTSTLMVPIMLNHLFAVPEERRRRYDLSALKGVVLLGAPTSADTKLALMDWLGPVYFEQFGGTEVGVIAWADPEDILSHPGSVGKAPPGVTLKIIGDDGRELADGEIGEIIANGPETQMVYLNDPEKTAAARVGDFMRTGDIGYLKDGYLYLCDRRVDLIITSGINVYPAEVEGALRRHPAIFDVAVVGAADPLRGEDVVAVVELAAGHTANEALTDAILAHARASLALYKCPRRVEYWPELPRSVQGKVLKRKIRDTFWEGHAAKI